LRRKRAVRARGRFYFGTRRGARKGGARAAADESGRFGFVGDDACGGEAARRYGRGKAKGAHSG